MKREHTMPQLRRFPARLAIIVMLLAALGAAACASTSVKGEYEASTGVVKK